MNFCSKCGKKFEKENVFCSKCGFKLDVKNESILGLKTAKETSAKLSKNKGNFIDQKTQQNKKTEERKKELEDFITRFSGNQKINIDDTEEFLEDSIQKPNKNIFKYILKRKKNLTLFILSVPLIKVLFHYLLYPIMKQDLLQSSRIISGTTFGNNYTSPLYSEKYRASFGDHIEVIINDELNLFIPAIITVSLLFWFFNDKIKAR